MIRYQFGNLLVFEIRIKCLHLTLHPKDKVFLWVRDVTGPNLFD